MAWGFDTKNLDRSVRPEDDFYHYTNGGWLKRAKIPEDEAWWGAFNELRYATDKQLKILLEELVQRRAVAGSPEQMIRDHYHSASDLKTRRKLGMRPLLPYLKAIEEVTSYDELLKVIGQLHRVGVDVLWGAGIGQDDKQSDKYRLHFYQSGLSLPDREYYLKDGAEQKRIRAAFVEHIKALLRLTGRSKEAERFVAVVMDIETRLARISMTKEDLRDADKTYHKMSYAAFKRLASNIDWDRYFKQQSIPLQKELVIMQPKFMEGTSRLLKQISLEDWKVYLTWHVINEFAGTLSPAFVRQTFDFYSRTLMGAKKMKPVWRRALSSVNGNLGELLGQLYVKKHFPPAYRRQVDAIVDDLFVAFKARIDAVDWMSPATKKMARYKLSRMGRKIGYPDKWKSYKGLVITPTDYFGNLLRIGEYEHMRAARKLKKPVDRSEWHMSPQTVNAYCSPNLNEIVFPAAILQRPFFDPSADDAFNYGALGMTIGHEMTHNFDDQGAKFDARGNLKSWWTAADKKRFEARGKVLVKQYGANIVIDDIKLNGQLTLGENIADLAGLSIAFDAYQLKLKRTGRKTIDGLTPEQRFFLAFTQGEVAKERPEFTKYRALNDCHSPVPFRANIPLTNMAEFLEAFNVQPGDKMYRAPKARAKVW